LDDRKESPTREGLLTLKSFELEKPESWPEGQTLILDNTHAKCANAQKQDPDCDDDRAEEQIPFSDSAHMRSPYDGRRLSGTRKGVRCSCGLGALAILERKALGMFNGLHRKVDVQARKARA
jgi:hypothetical protein